MARALPRTIPHADRRLSTNSPSTGLSPESCNFFLYAFGLQHHFDDGIAFWIERYRRDRRPVAGVARPPPRVGVSGLQVDDVTSGEDLLFVAGMPLRRADVADPTVPMLDVVPAARATLLFDPQ